MRRYIALTLILLIATPATAQVPSLRETALALHNEARERVGAPPLVWDPKLAADAEAWARELARRDRMEHSPWEIRPGQGENLSMGTRGAFSATTMMMWWVNERKDYLHRSLPDMSRTGNWKDVGHYTQIVWRDTTAVGCAMASSREWDYLVCRYSPAGNWFGELAY